MISYYMPEKDGKATTPSDADKFKKGMKSHTNIVDKCRGYISRKVKRMVAKNKN